MTDQKGRVAKSSEPSKWRWKAYLFLERPTGLVCFVYNIILLFIILFTIIYTSLATIPRIGNRTAPYVGLTDNILFISYLIEFSVRVWSVGCLQKYSGVTGRIKFMLKPLCMLDIMAILGLGVCIIHRMMHLSIPTNFIIIRCMRFLQFARLFHFDRYVTSWRILMSVFKEHLQELVTTVYFAFVFLVIVSYALWLTERNEDQSGLQSLADAMYCTLITMATIGYGDKVPQTFIGRLIISTVGIMGVFLWALPAGIIGSGFALKVKEERKKRRYIKLQPTAASLIQAWWRLKQASRKDSVVSPSYSIILPPVPDVFQQTPDHVVLHNNNGSQDGHRRDDISSPSTRKKDVSLMKTLDQDLIAATSESNMHTSWFMSIDQHRLATFYVRQLQFFVAYQKFRSCRGSSKVIDVLNENVRNYSKMSQYLSELKSKLDYLIGMVEGLLKSRQNSDASDISNAVQLVSSLHDKDDINRKMDRILHLIESCEKRLSKLDNDVTMLKCRLGYN